MRVLVLGATGYVGSRLVPALLEAGHEVVAASSSPADPDRFAWGDEVTWRQCDVTDRRAVERAVRDADGVCYLVHSLSRRGFADLDRVGADARARRRVDGRRAPHRLPLGPRAPARPRRRRSRPTWPPGSRSSTLLADADCSTLSVRAGVVIGAGSTSYEVVRQLASLLLVQPVPSWMRSSVQPVAVTDVVRALVAAFEDGAPEGDVDLGGPDVIRYPQLLAAYARAARLPRIRVPAVVAPVGVVAVATALLVGAPFRTVTALVESLRHDMVVPPRPHVAGRRRADARRRRGA